MGYSWKATYPRTLRKVVYALTELQLDKTVAAHEERGWRRVGDVKPHGYGVGILVEFPSREEVRV